MRGEGLFEMLSVYNDKEFNGFVRSNILDMHMDRLKRSADVLNINLPSIYEIKNLINHIAYENGEGVIKLYITKGNDDNL